MPRQNVLHCCLSLAASLALVCFGCGGGETGPQRYRVSGTVTYGGMPVPAGTIVFEPDASAGAKGPQGTARIEDGKFDTDTADGRGVVGGTHIVRISGSKSPSEAKVDSSGESVAPVLFTNYTTKVDFPKEASTHVLDVPPSAGKPTPMTNRPAGP